MASVWSHAATMDNDVRSNLVAALHSSGPADGLENALRAFGQFVGSWDLDWHVEGATAKGELHVGWVLDGRVIQDVWIVPERFYGSTLRFYDLTLGAWRSTWIEPGKGRVWKFIGREQDGQIVLVSLDTDPLQRWRFTEIGRDSFTWLGERSDDEARTWQLEETMRASRRMA